MANNKLDEKLKEVRDSLADNIKIAALDFTTLEVTTLTGSINHIMSGEKFMNSDGIMKMISKLPKSTATGTGAGSAVTKKVNVSVIAHTQIHFDHDTINFVKADLQPSEKHLFSLHQESIRSAIEGRNGFLGTLQKIIV